MGFLVNAFDKRSVTVVGDELWRSWKASNALSGITVTPDKAMTFSAVYAAHKILAESTAMLPLFLLKRLKPRGKEQATSHSLYGVLHDVANPEMDAYLVRETMTAHLVGWGKAFAKIDYDIDGQVSALWPIHPARVSVLRDRNKQLIFEVTLPDGQKKTYQWFEILYLRALSPDGINVYTPIKLAKEGIGLALAAEGFGASLFGNGATPNGVLQTDKALSDKAYNRLKEDWSGNHQGISNANKFDILEEGLKWQTTSIPNDDAQFLQTRVFQVEEVGRWYRIPNMMLNMSGANSTYASVEAFGLQFVIYTLYPWLVRWEKGISMQLLLERERKTLFAEHAMSAILRGDTNSRFAAYGTGRQWGWLSVNDIREFENMNPIDGGDTYLSPSNMVNVSEPSKIQRSYLPVLIDAIQRVLRREANDVRAAVQKILIKRGAEEFTDWMGEFYREHQEFIVRNLMPAALTYAEMVANGMDLSAVNIKVTESLRLFALRRAGQVQEQFKNALHEAEPARAIEGIMDGWDSTYVERIAKMEISRQTSVLIAPIKEPEWINQI
jgi:HK97 family phage portal protein